MFAQPRQQALFSIMPMSTSSPEEGTMITSVRSISSIDFCAARPMPYGTFTASPLIVAALTLKNGSGASPCNWRHSAPAA